MDDGLLGAADRVEGAVNEMVSALGQNLDRHVVGNVVPLDELAHEVEVGLARRQEPDLDLLVAHPHEQVEHPLLALGVHRVDERLVAVPEVDGAPSGCLSDPLRRPGAVGQLHGDLIMERYVLAERIPDGVSGWSTSLTSSCSLESHWSSARHHELRDEGGRVSGLVAAAKKKECRTHTARVFPRLTTRPAPP